MQLAAILNHLRGRPPVVSVINEFATVQRKNYKYQKQKCALTYPY